MPKLTFTNEICRHVVSIARRIHIIVTCSRKCIARSIFLTSVTSEQNEIWQKNWSQVHISLENLTILFKAFHTFISPFQSYGVAKKKLSAIIFFYFFCCWCIKFQHRCNPSWKRFVGKFVEMIFFLNSLLPDIGTVL